MLPLSRRKKLKNVLDPVPVCTWSGTGPCTWREVQSPQKYLVPVGRYKVLKSTLYLGAGTRYSKVPCTGVQVQSTWKDLVPTNRYKVQEVPCTSGTRYCTWHSSANDYVNYEFKTGWNITISIIIDSTISEWLVTVGDNNVVFCMFEGLLHMTFEKPR